MLELAASAGTGTHSSSLASSQSAREVCDVGRGGTGDGAGLCQSGIPSYGNGEYIANLIAPSGSTSVQEVLPPMSVEFSSGAANCRKKASV